MNASVRSRSEPVVLADILRSRRSCYRGGKDRPRADTMAEKGSANNRRRGLRRRSPANFPPVAQDFVKYQRVVSHLMRFAAIILPMVLVAGAGAQVQFQPETGTGLVVTAADCRRLVTSHTPRDERRGARLRWCPETLDFRPSPNHPFTLCPTWITLSGGDLVVTCVATGL